MVELVWNTLSQNDFFGEYLRERNIHRLIQLLHSNNRQRPELVIPPPPPQVCRSYQFNFHFVCREASCTDSSKLKLLLLAFVL